MFYSIMGAKRTFFWENLPPEKLWYLVGLITSDGCLSPDGRHIDITAKNEIFLQELSQKFQFTCKIGKKNNGHGAFASRIQFSSKSFYDFLIKIGLMPNKSKILSSLNVPSEYFSHFVRGVIDGDGSIRHWTHPQNGGEQWIVKVVSGSEEFLKWLSLQIYKLYRLSGSLHPIYNSSVYTLKFGKLVAQELLKICYPSHVFALPEKMRLAQKCIRTKRGWTKSKTVENKISPGGESGKHTGLNHWVSSLATER